MHKSKRAGNISLNILGSNLDDDLALKGIFSVNLIKGKNEESHVSIDNSNSIKQPKIIRLKDINRVIIGNLNTNSLTVTFAQLQEIVLKYVDILILTETKLDDSFPTSQFIADDFQCLIDRNETEAEVV